MSKAAPAIPFFGDAYIADTRHLTLEEHGAYLQLLMIAWRSPDCALPNDDKRIAQMLGITSAKWGKLKPTIMAFWRIENGRWTQKRLRKERKFVSEKSEKNSQAAKNRWNSQAAENKGNDKSERISERTSERICQNDAPPPPPTQEVSKSPPNPPSLPDDVRAVLEAGGYASAPGDIALLRQWYEAGADLNDVTSVIRREAAQLRNKGQGAPRTLKIFDAAVREKLADDERQIEHLRKVARRNQDQPAAAGGQP